MKHNIYHFDTIDSTNTYAKRNLDILHHGDVIIADHQTQGRGRKDHVWVSAPKDNMLASIVIKEPWENIQRLAQVTALSVVYVCRELHIDAKIKFPNDIYAEDKKLSGILIETIFDPDLKGIIIGTGINVKSAIEGAACINDYQTSISTEEIFHSYLRQFDLFYEMAKEHYDILLEEVNKISYLKDKIVEYEGRLVQVGKLKDNGMIEIIEGNQATQIYSNEFHVTSLHKK